MIVYFHGFGSSPNSAKVDLLRETGEIVVAPRIPLDPNEAVLHLVSFVRKAIKDAMDAGDRKVVFVGTSLGGYWAALMSELFDATCVLVNPSFSPKESLMKYVDGYTDYTTGENKKLPVGIVEKYINIDPKSDMKNRHFFLATKDPVVVPVKVPHYHPNVFCVETDDHQGTSFFPMVVQYTKNLLESATCSVD